ncbi:alpha/beta hydrolase [uncultured Pelagimonas sp.]|uniref:alpha/beta hydrolase n=1 Tax=uncultured Pelagimonas sp. TaxID=1618102 RepID=UPI002606C4BD|nr:alpha/beta hydrolase [uncultured Pelagimonas sp.]
MRGVHWSQRLFSTAHRLLFWVLGACVALILSGCGGPPPLIGIENPKVAISDVPGLAEHKIFLATTRQPTEVAGAFFSNQRAESVGFAAVTVTIPPDHRPGTLSRARQLPPDPRKHYTIVEPVRYESDDGFIAALNSELAKRPKGQREVLFFVHGYNTSTTDSLLHLAQFVQDSGYHGVPVLFDWASAGKLSRYVYDINSALIARSQMAKIQSVLGQTQAEGYDVFSYSMGGLVVMEGLSELALKNQLTHTDRLKRVVLASPDIDMDLFRTQIKNVGAISDRMYVLISKDDGVLNMAKLVAGGVPRVGASDAQELAELGVVAIDLSEIDDSNSGNHSKFSGSPEVVKLLGRGLNRNQNFSRTYGAEQLKEMLIGLPISVAF